MQQLSNIILILGIAQGFFLALLLRRRHWKLYANRMLAALMAVYGVILLNLLLQDIGFHEAHPKLWLLLSGLPLVTGPLHFLYARHLIHPARRWRRRDVLHLLPFIAYKFTELPLLFLPDAAVAQLLADVAGSGIPERFFWFNWAIIVQGTLYMGATLLTLPALAQRMELSPHNLSEVINTRFGQNFFDLVNGYRVQEVCTRLSDPASRQFTVLAIAFDAGFNSKTSFNTIFKRHTGMTPSAYRDARAKYEDD